MKWILSWIPFSTDSHSALARSGPSPIIISRAGIFFWMRSKISITS